MFKMFQMACSLDFDDDHDVFPDEALEYFMDEIRGKLRKKT